MDGTPILDIKPYIPYTDSHPEARGGFTDTTDWHPLKVVGTDDSVLKQILEQDPRPHYHDDPDRIYGLMFDGHDLHFRVRGDQLEVV
jgi:hypothetical protein